MERQIQIIMAKIVTVFKNMPNKEYDKHYSHLVPANMAYIRWLKVSEALEGTYHSSVYVDISTYPNGPFIG